VWNLGELVERRGQLVACEHHLLAYFHRSGTMIDAEDDKGHCV
jgi:hypothetical protein